MGRPPQPIKERFMSKVDLDIVPGCWIWKGSFGGHEGKHAYGRFYYMDKNVMAHRFAYEFISLRKIPENYDVDHLCKNPRCVNPEHLQSLSKRDNTFRSNNPMAINARKTHCINGHELTGKDLYIAKNGTRKCYACIKIRGKKYREINKQKLKIIQNEWYEKNKEDLKIKHKLYWEKNKEYLNAWQEHHKSQKKLENILQK